MPPPIYYDIGIACEPALAALFLAVQATVSADFTADADGTTNVLTNVSSVTGLWKGMPVFGPNVLAGTWLQSWTANPNTITVSQAPTAACTAGAFSTGFQTASRRFKWWNDKDVQMPALFMRHTGTLDEYQGVGLGRATVEVELYIYSAAGQDPDFAPDVALSALVAGVRLALMPDSSDKTRCTLGGLVYWARAEGRSIYQPGDIGPVGVAYIPVKITIP